VDRHFVWFDVNCQQRNALLTQDFSFSCDEAFVVWGFETRLQTLQTLFEFRKFLDEIEAAVPHDLDVHLVMDNYATHKAPLIRSWLAKRPRWHVHLTPTSSSWLNQVERFFALITDKKIRRGIYRSVQALRADIMDFISHHNANPKPFKWIKSADDILASIERFCRYNTQVQAS